MVWKRRSLVVWYPLQEKLDAINTALVLYQVLISSVKQNRDIETSEILKKKTKQQ